MDYVHTSYKAIFNNHYYKDKETTVYNDGIDLSFQLDDVVLVSEYAEFVLKDQNVLDKSISEKLKIVEIPYSHSGDCYYPISHYSLCIKFSFNLISASNDEVISIETDLIINGKTGWQNIPSSQFIFMLKFELLGNTHVIESLEFEGLMIQFQKILRPKYELKNCFGCQYSDYWPAGNQIFGGMMCFKKHKQQYLEIKSKSDILNFNHTSDQVQEIHCCDEFEIRKPGTGYRG